jgi:dienelactone hydrolase
MTVTRLGFLAIALLGFGSASLLAQPPGGADLESIQARQRLLEATTPDTPGTGAYPAIKVTDPGLPELVIYRPENLDALGDTRLGIYAFGNGSCTDDAAHSRLHVLEIASHGYLAIVPGRIYSGPGAVERTAQPAEPATHAEQLIQAIDWALAENERRGSPYYDRIDPEAVAISGFSCGGLQALSVAADPRIRTAVIMNSGLFVDGPTRMAGMEYTKELLDDLHFPTLYILGGQTDIAYDNGMDDFRQIDHVPVAVANIDKGHGGTYWEPNGGPAAAVAVAWLEWQLRGDRQAGQTFLGEHCGLCTDPQWAYEKKRLR